ncbi:hypothetical protein BD413DRAFT_225471 [Trametes elegans]|nr:hypothetical protein BD413DRAFT_225471 [Trametes elegans]
MVHRRAYSHVVTIMNSTRVQGASCRKHLLNGPSRNVNTKRLRGDVQAAILKPLSDPRHTREDRSYDRKVKETSLVDDRQKIQTEEHIQDAGEESQDQVVDTQVALDETTLFLECLKGDKPPNADWEFWFEDGNVILVAGDVHFLVYQGLLATRSSVLSDLFAFPPKKGDFEESYSNGGPLTITLSDSPEDLRYLLRIYMPSKKVLAHRTTFECISAYVRLGYKYQITELYQEALAVLKGYFPASFDDWNSIERDSFFTCEDIHSIGAVNLARLMDEPTLLPAALWRCCRLGSDLVYGFTRKDGTQEHLTWEDLGLCFAAKGRILKAGVRARLRTFYPVVDPKCKSDGACRSALLKLGRALEEDLDGVAETDPLVPYTRIPVKDKLPLCSNCRAMVRARDERERRVIWDRLPQLLGIEVPGWGQDFDGSDA